MLGIIANFWMLERLIRMRGSLNWFKQLLDWNLRLLQNRIRALLAQLVVHSNYNVSWISRIGAHALLLLIVDPLHVGVILIHRVHRAIGHLRRQLQRLILQLPNKSKPLSTIDSSKIWTHLIEIVAIVSIALR